jgi:hypothetical protein
MVIVSCCPLGFVVCYSLSWLMSYWIAFDDRGIVGGPLKSGSGGSFTEFGWRVWHRGCCLKGTSSCQITSTECLAARLEQDKWCLIDLEEDIGEKRPRDAAQAISRSWRHLGQDFTWFSNSFCVLQGVPQEKQKATMVTVFERAQHCYGMVCSGVEWGQSNVVQIINN